MLSKKKNVMPFFLRLLLTENQFVSVIICIIHLHSSNHHFWNIYKSVSIDRSLRRIILSCIGKRKSRRSLESQPGTSSETIFRDVWPVSIERRWRHRGECQINGPRGVGDECFPTLMHLPNLAHFQPGGSACDYALPAHTPVFGPMEVEEDYNGPITQYYGNRTS